MKPANRTFLIIALVIVALLFLLFAGGALTGVSLSGNMMGSGMMGGISWMWIPTLIILGIGILLGWFIFGKK